MLQQLFIDWQEGDDCARSLGWHEQGPFSECGMPASENNLSNCRPAIVKDRKTKGGDFGLMDMYF